MTRVLVVGFGPFLEIRDNPAARVAAAVDGQSRGSLVVIGRQMPVSYQAAPALTAAWAAEVGADAVVGVGLARQRGWITVEAVGRRWADPGLPDCEGRAEEDLEPGGPAEVRATAPLEPLAAAMGAIVGADAGRYVCNAWLYRVVRALGAHLPVAFIHIPPAGLAPESLLAALEAAWGDGGPHG